MAWTHTELLHHLPVFRFDVLYILHPYSHGFMSSSCKGRRKICSSPLPSPPLCPAIVGQGHPKECKSTRGPSLLWRRKAALRASRAESFLQATGVKPILVGCCFRRQWFDLLGALRSGCYWSPRSPKGYQEMHDNATSWPCSFAYNFSV